MNQDALQVDDIQQVLAGDAARIDQFVGHSQSEIAAIAGRMTRESLTVTPRAIRRVLLDLLQEQISPEQAQMWANFVKRGHVLTKEKPLQVIATHYQTDREDEIVEALSRLDELGDVVDGSIDDNELKQLINLMHD